MTSPVRISLCFAAVAMTALAACSQASTDESALVFEATTSAKFQNSLAKIKTGLSDDEQVALMQAMNALEVYPLDGNCDVNNILAHIQQFADPAFRQKVRLRPKRKRKTVIRLLNLSSISLTGGCKNDPDSYRI